jgi:hypothetical protein
MKKVRLYLLVFAVLAILSVYLILTRRSGTYAPARNKFAIEDTRRVEDIRISSPEGKVELMNNQGEWTVKGYPVRKESLRGLNILISRIEIEAPVSAAREAGVQKGLRENSTRVSIDLGGGEEKKYRVFYDSSANASFMKMSGSDISFRVKVRGYRETNLQQLFETDLRYWRDNLVFQLLPDDIQSVSLVNYRDEDASFHLARDEEGHFRVAGGLVPGEWIPPGKDAIVQYLGYFSEVRFERFLDPAVDTLQHDEHPAYILSLETGERLQIQLELYPVQPAGTGGGPVTDYNRLYGRLGKEDEWVVLKYIQIDPLLQDFEYFREF